MGFFDEPVALVLVFRTWEQFANDDLGCIEPAPGQVVAVLFAAQETAELFSGDLVVRAQTRKEPLQGLLSSSDLPIIIYVLQI